MIVSRLSVSVRLAGKPFAPVAPMLAPSDRVLISTMLVDLVECCSPMRNQVVSKGEIGAL
jgi:hypothetical protein